MSEDKGRVVEKSRQEFLQEGSAKAKETGNRNGKFANTKDAGIQRPKRRQQK